MKILLDECLPVSLAKEFQEYDVYTINDLGWIGKKDKELIDEASKNNFDVFITVDKGIEKQIHIANYNLTIITVKVPKNILEFLIPVIRSFKKDLTGLEKRKFYHINIGSKITRIN